MSSARPKLWVEEPVQLVKHPTLIPNTRMCNEELINTFTRIIILIAIIILVIAYFTSFTSYLGGLCFLIIGLVIVGAVGVLVCRDETRPPVRVENFRRRPPQVRKVRRKVTKTRNDSTMRDVTPTPASTRRRPRMRQRYAS